MTPSICTNCFTEANIAEVFDGCAEAGFDVSIGLSDISSYGIDFLIREQARSKVGVSSVSMIGFFTDDPRDMEHDCLIEHCAALKCPRLTVVTGGIKKQSQTITHYKDQVLRGLDPLLPRAAAAGVTLFLEPFHPMFATSRSALVDSLSAVEIIEATDRQLGLMIDTYHLWHERNFLANLGTWIKEYHCCVQISDWPFDGRSIFRDRCQVGDGAIDFPGVFSALKKSAYQGAVEFEVMSDRYRSMGISGFISDCVGRWNKFNV